MEQEVSRCQTSDIKATPEDDVNNLDYTRGIDRIINYSSTGSRCEMPEQLLFDILLWLPVITLLRFKSVCKSWYALICSSDFIIQQFDHKCGKDNLLGVAYDSVYCEDDAYKFYFGGDGYKFCLLSGEKYEMRNNFDCGQFESVVKPRSVELALSSYGMICLVHSSFQAVVLWNPAVKQLKPLSKSSISFQLNVDYIFYGFGYNVKNNDYKVVRIIVRGEEKYNNVVEVYSLRDDSWRTILENAMLDFGILNQAISKNGTCFWVSYAVGGFNSRAGVILSFDLNDETFGTMSFPEGTEGFSVSLDFLGDKLACMMGSEYPEWLNGASYYEIWLLHEYGLNKSWIKAWKIGPTDILGDDFLFPYGFSKNGDYLLLNDDVNGQIYLYNFGTKENEYLQLQQPNPSFMWFVYYTESLVSVKRVNDA